MILLDTKCAVGTGETAAECACGRVDAALGRRARGTDDRLAEMAYGIEKLARDHRREALLGALRRLVVEFADRLLDFNVEAAWAYGRILASARGAGRPMAVPDTAIAALAQANRCALATRNLKDFATTGLELVDPWRRDA